MNTKSISIYSRKKKLKLKKLELKSFIFVQDETDLNRYHNDYSTKHNYILKTIIASVRKSNFYKEGKATTRQSECLLYYPS